MQPEKLVHTNRTERYLEELEAHAEDAGDPSIVGREQELTKTFNLYAKPVRNRRIAIVASIALLSFITVYYALNFAFTSVGPPLLPRPVHEIFMLTGALFYLPFLVMFVIPSSLLLEVIRVRDQQLVETIMSSFFIVVPFCTAVFWGAVTWAICFWPKEYFTRKRKRV